MPASPSDDGHLDATAPLAAGSELAIGACIGRFVVLRTIGAGGMGVVVAAYDPVLDRKVALKLLRAASTDAGDELLIREAQAMARLSHPNVVAVHEAGVADHRVYLAMELIEGDTLRGWLAAAPRSWREIRDRFLDAGRGLAAAHDAGLVHRDFKPDNVLVGRDGRTRVTDFGLVRPSPAAPELAGDHTTVAGTPRYMAPEQHTGQRADARADQFAFCVALYEALWAGDPFAAADTAARNARVIAGEIAPPPAGKLPARLTAAVLRGLAAAPDARHPTMQALLTELAYDPARARRRLWRQLAVGAAGAGLATAIALAVMPRRGRDPAPPTAVDVVDAPDPLRFQRGVAIGWGAASGQPRAAWPAVEAAALELAARAGVTATDLPLAWSEIEPARGARDWADADRRVAALELRGLEPFAVAGGAPGWLGRDPAAACGEPLRNPPPNTAAGHAAFHDFFRALASRYCGRVKHYQLASEPNGCGWMSCGCGDQTPAQRRLYAMWLTEWYQAMRDGCSDLVLAVGALDCRWGSDPAQPAVGCAGFVDELYAYGAGDSFDAVALRADGYRADLEVEPGRLINWDAIRLVTAALGRHGSAHRPLWVDWRIATGDAPRRARAIAAALGELRGAANVTAARYTALTDPPDAPIASGLAAWGAAAADPPLVAGPGWAAFRDRALGPGVTWHGPVNPGLEFEGDPPSQQFTSPIPFWGPDGAWALHTRFPRAGNAVLGRKFGYYAAGSDEQFRQTLTDRFAANRRYCFRSAAQGGYARTGVLPYQIGYVDPTAGVIVLRSQPVAVDARWRQTPGVCHDVATGGPEVDRPIAVQFGSAADGGANDIWFDNLAVTSTAVDR